VHVVHKIIICTTSSPMFIHDLIGLFFEILQSSSLRRSDLDVKNKNNSKSTKLSDEDLETKRTTLLAQLHDEKN